MQTLLASQTKSKRQKKEFEIWIDPLINRRTIFNNPRAQSFRDMLFMREIFLEAVCVQN